MKKKLIQSLLLSCILSSCSYVLDVAPEGRKELDEIFSSEITTGSYFNSCYQDFPKFTFGDYFWTSNLVSMSDDAWEISVSGAMVADKAYKGGITPATNDNLLIRNSKGENFVNITSWDLYYRNINRCNIFIERIDKAAVPSEIDRIRWRAEARILRAFYYMELLGRFGDIPLFTSSTPVGYDASQLKKETFKNVVDYIISECKDVIENVPELPWRISVASEDGRMTKGVAAAIMSRSILWAASPLWNGGQNYWKEAEEITGYALNKMLENGYELYSKVSNPGIFGDNAYYEYNCTLTDFATTPIDKESILTSKKNIGHWWNIQGVPISIPNKVGLCPTQELVDAIPMKTGKYILDLKQPYLDENHLQPNYEPNSGYDPENPYVDRDPRFEALIIHNGSKVKDPKDQLVEVQTYNGGNCGLKMGTANSTCTGYYARKHYHPNARKNRDISVRPRIMRLAEMYLNYAEACAENGNIDGALAAVKPIRDRVNMPNIPGGSKEDVILQVRNERRVEMAYEDNRYYDIRRWTSPGNDMPVGRIQTGMWIEKLKDGKLKYMRFRVGDEYNPDSNTWSGTGWERKCFESKYLLHPLEQIEADRLRAATGVNWQNPGW